MPCNISDLPSEAQSALKQFPEFEIASFNDSGANGYVLIGRHTLLQKQVAIKIYFHGENDIDQEPAIIAKINHENVLKVYDARKVRKDCSYFMTPAASEGDLSKFLDNYFVPLPLSLKLLCQLLSGIADLHREPNLLVHRDLKPENLLVHDETILIADFGSVRRIDKNTGNAPASKHSILYRPPEAFGEEAFFNFSSDIYQAGMIGFLLFGGELSNDLLSYATSKQKSTLASIKGDYEKAKYVDSFIEEKICRGSLLNFNTLPFYIPNSIKRVLRFAVSPVNKRYISVSEFLADLLRLRNNLPDWMMRDEGVILRNWKGMDYRLPHDEVAVYKRRAGGENFRRDNNYLGNSHSDLFAQMKDRLGLP
ncbi:protein kinase family protein [Burkholderia cepacia]|uniref:protein kinase family protein n=1 Tax=Burkholderia cepacia TaxID=292 RepID=UPI001CF450A1|nr:protein kinase family protein [Burkholderia cepacia]MCA7979890.1 protein kinase family protein [Burkholderia cepacia]